jgi:hypothetical protein
MSKTKSSTKFRHGVKSVNPWDLAISDAEKAIEAATSKITQLKRAIRAFKVMRDAGEPWPGSVEAGVSEAKTEEPRRLRQALG